MIAGTNRVEGRKYAETCQLSERAVAALIRADLKAAVETREIPCGFKFRVRRRTASYSAAIDITITGIPAGFRIYDREHLRTGRPGWMSTEASAIRRRVEAVAAAYNYDNSQIEVDYFDVRFYSSVDFAWQLKDAEREVVFAELEAERVPARPSQSVQESFIEWVAA